MEWLNYHHLFYFWTVAREGSIAKAQNRLRLAQPTISGQIRMLEASLGEKLFQRQGRNLALTEMGRVVYRYAEDIFTLGRELQDTLKGRPTGKPVRLVVGIADVIPKMVAHRLLVPVYKMKEPVHMICREDHTENLIAMLANHTLDLVLADKPTGSTSPVKAFSHLLGQCGISFLGNAALAAKLRRSFPASLENAPILLPTEGTMLRRSIERWFDDIGVKPLRIGEFDDTALMKVFGEDGIGVFPIPSVIEKDVCRQFRVQLIGRTDKVRESYYAVSVERRIKHPAVIAMTQAARQIVFI